MCWGTLMRASSVLRLLIVLLCVSASAVKASAQAQCTLSTTNQTVTICTPANGATVPTTFHVNAGATDSNTVSWIGLWVNTQPIVTQNGKVLDATVTLPAGNNTRFVVEAKDSTGAVFKTVYSINITAGTQFSISPQNPTVSEGANQQFTASKAATSSSSCGSIDATGLFTAPLSQPSCTVKATATDGSGNTASTSVNISSPVSVTPSSASTIVNQKQQFSAQRCGDVGSIVRLDRQQRSLHGSGNRRHLHHHGDRFVGHALHGPGNRQRDQFGPQRTQLQPPGKTTTLAMACNPKRPFLPLPM